MTQPETTLPIPKSVYSVPKKDGIEAVIVLAVILAGGLWFLSAPVGIIIILVIATAIALQVLATKEYTYSITLDAAEKQLELITKSRTSTQKEYFSFYALWFVYKKRIDYFSATNGSLKEKRDILLIESKRKTLAFLVPQQDGWTQQQILQLAREMAALGIEQKIDKYDDNEIVLGPTSSP